MPGTKRTITYLEGKFQTGDIPTQEDFYDLFASFIHYLQLAQGLGTDAEIPMSQAAVTAAITELITGIPVDITYPDIAAMLADQASQTTDNAYMVTNAAADPSVTSGWAIYQKTAASTADLSDYVKIAEQESLDLIVQNASETVKGIVEEATDAEVTAGTATGGTGAKLFVTPTKLATRLTPASQAEMLTGTDNVKIATAKSVEDKGSVKSRTVSNSATGSTNIDCLGANQFKAVFNTTVTGAITLTWSGDSALEILNIALQITGASITVQFPSTVRMDRIFEGGVWNQSTKVLTLAAVGTADWFEFSLMKMGSVFELRYGGPARA